MRYSRFQVATCEGYAIRNPRARPRNGAPGLTATVCDSAHLFREVKSYRSEDQVMRNGERTTRGVEDARRAAEDHADYLNRLDRRAKATERMRGYRANGARARR